MCPNCCQHVSRDIEKSYSYRSKWLRHVQAISNKKGWDWQYERVVDSGDLSIDIKGE